MIVEWEKNTDTNLHEDETSIRKSWFFPSRMEGKSELEYSF